jgi:hypothetical protein
MNKIDNNNIVDNNELLNTYIQQIDDQEYQIIELKKNVWDLKNQIEDYKKELIKKDIIHILEEEAFEIEDETINEIVNYIIKRENK